MPRPLGKKSRTPESYNPYQRPLLFPEPLETDSSIVLPKEEIISVLIHKKTDSLSLVSYKGQLYIRSLDAGKMLGWALGKMDVDLPDEQVENLKKGSLGRIRTGTAADTPIMVGSDDSFVELKKVEQILNEYMSSDDRLLQNILPRAQTTKTWSSAEMRTKFLSKLTGLFVYVRKTAASEVSTRLRHEASQPRPKGRQLR